MVIIALYTLVSMVLIGRGVFCGWLCPFGALQELLGQLSRAIGVPQWNPPHRDREALVAGQVHRGRRGAGAGADGDRSRRGPRSRSSRSRPRSPQNSRALGLMCFMPVLCLQSGCSPSGPIAASCVRWVACSLSLIGCTSSICLSAVPNAAIRAICANGRARSARSSTTGKIVTAECFQCLDCQVEYYDDQPCPPLVQARRRDDAKPAVPVAAMVKNA